MTTLHSFVVVVVIAVVVVVVVAAVVAGSAVDLSSRGVPTAEPASSRESSKLVTLDSNVAVDGILGSKRLVLFFLTSCSIDDSQSLLLGSAIASACPCKLLKEEMQIAKEDRPRRMASQPNGTILGNAQSCPLPRSIPLH